MSESEPISKQLTNFFWENSEKVATAKEHTKIERKNINIRTADIKHTHTQRTERTGCNNNNKQNKNKEFSHSDAIFLI